MLFSPSCYDTHCPQLTAILARCLWTYKFSLDWTSAIRLADLCSISFSSGVNGCFTMCVTPFSPRTQGRDRNTSLSMPCWPWKITTNFASERMAHFSLPVPISIEINVIGNKNLLFFICSSFIVWIIPLFYHCILLVCIKWKVLESLHSAQASHLSNLYFDLRHKYLAPSIELHFFVILSDVIGSTSHHFFRYAAYM